MNRILNRNVIRYLAVLSAAVLLFGCGQKSEIASGDIIRGETGIQLDTKLTPLIEETMQAYDLPGFAIGVVENNEVVYARGFGVKNIDTKEPVTITTKTRFYYKTADSLFATRITFADLAIDDPVSVNGTVKDFVWTTTRITVGATLDCLP